MSYYIVAISIAALLSSSIAAAALFLVSFLHSYSNSNGVQSRTNRVTGRTTYRSSNADPWKDLVN